MERQIEFSPDYLAERAASFVSVSAFGSLFAARAAEFPVDDLICQADDVEMLEQLVGATRSLSHEEARLAFLAGVAQRRIGVDQDKVGELLEHHDEYQRIVDNWSGPHPDGRHSDDYLALGRLKETKEALARYSPDVGQARKLWSARVEVEDQVKSLLEVRDAALDAIEKSEAERGLHPAVLAARELAAAAREIEAQAVDHPDDEMRLARRTAVDVAEAAYERERNLALDPDRAYQAGRRFAADPNGNASPIDFSEPPKLYRLDEFERGVSDYEKERNTVPETSREEKTAASRIEGKNEMPERLGVSSQWIQEQAAEIREQAAHSVTADMVGVHTAYLNGRRETFNALRADVIEGNEALEKDLPAAIGIDEIVVRQQVLEQEREAGRSLHSAIAPGTPRNPVKL